MEKIDNNFPFRPLRLEQNEIRVLALLPGPQGSKIDGILLHCSLDDSAFPFDALSYTWGDPEDCTAIQLDGAHDFKICSELELALQDLRLESEVRVIWIDAICINQKDVAERNQQVRIMRKIYGRAATVRVWLNHTIDTADPALAVMSSFSSRSVPADLGDDPKLWRPISRIFELKYWKRVWIQQEVDWARELKIHCRRHVLPGRPFAHLVRLIRDRHYNRKATVTEQVFDITWLAAGLKYPPFYFRPRAVWEEAKSTDLPSQERRFDNLLDALGVCRDSKATDPRDKIYGVLGLVKNIEDDEIIVDYSKTVAEVYVSAAQSILDRFDSVGFLYLCYLGDSCPEHDLPTWIPDWSHSSIGQMPMLGQMALKRETIISQNTSSEIIHNGRCLRVSGFLVDKVLKLYDKFVPSDTFSDVLPLVIFNTWDEIIRTAAKLRMCNGDGNENEIVYQTRALFRTLLRIRTAKEDDMAIDQYAFLSRFYKQVQSELQGTITWENKGDIPESEDWNLWSRLTDTMFMYAMERHLFITHDAVLGLAPISTQPEDEIWDIFGCPTPVMLRPTDKGYIVVGGVHLDQNMEGEIKKKMADGVELGKNYEIRQIELY